MQTLLMPKAEGESAFCWLLQARIPRREPPSAAGLLQTYLPSPSEQLILLPDAMSTTPCVGWVLYVLRDEKMFPVTFSTAKLKEYMVKWYPCEKEAVGVVLSIDQCAHWINESELPTRSCQGR